jgi:lysozyme family protein
MAAVASKEPVAIIADFCHLREAHYKSLSTFATFGKGWMRRLDGIEAESKHLA